MKIWVLNKIVPLPLFSWYLTFIFHLSSAVSKKYTSVLFFLGNKGIWLCTLARETKVSNYKSWREKKNCHTKWTNLNIINTLKPKALSYHLKLKTAISHFVFQIFHVNKLWWFVSSNWIYSLVKNRSAKLPFVTKNSNHLVGTSGDDSSAQIEFTPLWKTRVSNYPLQIKRNLIGCL